MSYEYKVAGQTVHLDADPTVVAVRFKPGPMSFRAGATAAEVARIITSTADKVGQFPYVGGRNDHFGAGRLNVYAAVRKAQAGRAAASAPAG